MLNVHPYPLQLCPIGHEMDLLTEKRNINPDKAMAMLKADGVIINSEDAALAVDFLYFLALLFYKQHAAEL